MQIHTTALFQSLNSVDYQDVVALEGHVKTTLSDIEPNALSMKDGNPIVFSCIET